MRRALPLLLLCFTAHAAEVVQFRAEDFGADWRATRGGASLRTVHPATNGWGAAFADWVERNPTNAAWLAALPAPPSRLETNDIGGASLPVGFGDDWFEPHTVASDNYLHHDAAFELRSVPQPGAHGHQATYRADGMLITNTIAAGTADFAAPSPKIDIFRLLNHRKEDVLPFIRALQLDGNPCLPDNGGSTMTELFPRNLNRPALFEGQNTRRYIEHRPTLPTGITNIP